MHVIKKKFGQFPHFMTPNGNFACALTPYCQENSLSRLKSLNSGVPVSSMATGVQIQAPMHADCFYKDL